ncbi:hypothetical protein P4S60_10315 [Pseudoalteromonas sp. Hal040]|uniref:hypothetical protein n=1 Tax=unclassified Pseudoalteromonas TaxID=194690 RepID=UPI00301CDA18
MKITQPISSSPLENLNKAQPQKPNDKLSQSNFAALLDDQVTLQNGGGGHPDKKKTEN